MIANTLNNFFKDIGKALHNQIAPSNIIDPETITNPHTIWLFETTAREVTRKILNLKNSNTTKDYISSRSCKDHAHKLGPIISNLINNCFERGVFPDELKYSRIVPIFENGSPLLATKYRLISILPVLSKIIESIFHDRLTNFISRHQITNKNQYGFQKKSGTLSAAASFVDMIQTNLDKTRNNMACCFFIDLRKAFDTVPHKLLLRRLQQYGIRGNALAMCTDYLKDRKQLVEINNVQSETVTNNNHSSLPQGSNLGPLFFILFINGIFDLK